MLKSYRFFVALALTLSTQLALVAPSAAVTWSYNGAISLTASSYSVSETGGSVTLIAVRNGGTHGVESVSYKTVNETAIAGAQYTAETGTLTWADGDGSHKTFTIPILDTKAFSGTKYFAVRLTAGTSTMLGSPTSAIVNIVGGSATVSPTVTKSIRAWVSCNETIDESLQLEQALLSAANNAFTLLIDCPVRFHTGTAATSSIAVPDGVTISFASTGEFLIVSGGPPALTVAHPATDAFFNWHVTYL